MVFVGTPKNRRIYKPFGNVSWKEVVQFERSSNIFRGADWASDCLVHRQKVSAGGGRM